MRKQFLHELRCPYSGSPLRLQSGEEAADGVLFGIAASEVYEFPIVAGILRLPVDELRVPLVEMIRQKRPRAALAASLDVPYHERGGAAINFATRAAFRSGMRHVARAMTGMKRRLVKVLTDDRLSFRETLEGLGARSWAEWEAFRFSMETFLPVFPLLHLVRDGRPVLDFASGVGQAAFLISRLNPNSEIVCADYSFSALFLARKYFVPQAECVCLDGDFLLPFAPARFASIYSSDALHCIDSKVSLVNEFRRILTADGRIVLPHLHNRCSAVRFGSSLTPGGYDRLFEDMERRVLASETIVEGYFGKGELDLRVQPPLEKLNMAVDGLSLVASRDPTTFVRYTGLWERYIERMRNPVVNPLYCASRRGGDWELTRRDAPQAPGKGRNGAAFLPRRIRLNVPSLESSVLLELRTKNSELFAKLTREFVFLEVPERYQRAG